MNNESHNELCPKCGSEMLSTGQCIKCGYNSNINTTDNNVDTNNNNVETINNNTNTNIDNNQEIFEEEPKSSGSFIWNMFKSIVKYSIIRTIVSFLFVFGVLWIIFGSFTSNKSDYVLITSIVLIFFLIFFIYLIKQTLNSVKHVVTEAKNIKGNIGAGKHFLQGVRYGKKDFKTKVAIIMVILSFVYAIISIIVKLFT